VKTKVLYLEKWEVYLLQNRLIQYIYTCSPVPTCAGSTFQTQFLELPTGGSIALCSFVSTSSNL
jgi:hypothetical protein